jgi:hypothetical protein
LGHYGDPYPAATRLFRRRDGRYLASAMEAVSRAGPVNDGQIDE